MVGTASSNSKGINDPNIYINPFKQGTRGAVGAAVQGCSLTGPAAGRAQDQPGRDHQTILQLGGVSSTRYWDFSKFLRSLPSALKHFSPRAVSAVGLGDTMIMTSSWGNGAF